MPKESLDLEKGGFNIGAVMRPLVGLVMMMVLFQPTATCGCACTDCGYTWTSSRYIWGMWTPSLASCPQCGSVNVQCTLI